MNTNECLVKFVRKKQYEVYTYFECGRMMSEIVDTNIQMDVDCLCEINMSENQYKILLTNKDHMLALKSKDMNGRVTEDLYKIESVIFSPSTIFSKPYQIFVVVKEIEDVGNRFVDDKYKKLSSTEIKKIFNKDYYGMDAYGYEKYNHRDEIMNKIPEWDRKLKSEFYKQNTQE